MRRGGGKGAEGAAAPGIGAVKEAADRSAGAKGGGAPRGRGGAFFLRGRDEGFRRRAATALLFLATIPMLTKIFTSDFGTHIALGRQIVETRSIADKEFLNYPSLGMNQPNPVWLFQVILYLVFSAGGPYAVSFMLWALVAGIFFLLHRATVVRGADPLVAVAAIVAFSGFLRIRIQPRPETFTYLFVSLTIYILTEYYYGRRKKLIYLFPPLMLVWANCHPSYLIAFVLCGAFFADALARAAWNGRIGWAALGTWVFPPLAAGAAGLLLCGLNPAGYEMILAPIITITRGALAGGGSPIMMSISELTPVKGTGMYLHFKAAAVFVAVSLVLGAVGRKIFLLDLFLFAIAFKGAWDSARAVSMMGLFLSPGISSHLTGFLGRVGEWAAARGEGRERAIERQGGKSRPKKKGKEAQAEGKPAPRGAAARPSLYRLRTAAAAAVLAACMVFGGVTLAFSFSQLEFGAGMTRHKFSFAAAEFLRRNPPGGNMFNFFDVGGFLDWQLYPQALTFIDGRTYNQQVFLEHQTVTGALPGWKEILDRYRVNYLVLKGMDSSGMILPIVSVLAGDPDWSLVFSDGLFLIFVRNSPANAEYLRRHEMPKIRIPEHIVWEAYHYMYLGVSPLIAYQTMSNMYLLLGNRPAAAAVLRKALEVEEVPQIRARLAQLEQGPVRTP